MPPGPTTENFPVASLLFPRALRPHLRAVYGFARLVDILGDEAEGDRLALLDELEREVEACYTGEPSWPVMQQLQPTIREFDLPREPFLRLIEATGWISGSPSTRPGTTEALLRAIRPTRSGGWCSGCCGWRTSRSSSPPPTTSAPGSSSSTSSRTFRATSRSGASTSRPRTAALRGDVLDRPSERADAGCCGSRRSGRAGCSGAGKVLRERIGGRLGRAVGLFARGGLAALDTLEEAGWDVFTQRPRPSRLAARAGGAARREGIEQAYAEVERITRERARNFAFGIMVLPKREAPRDRGDLRLCARGGRHRRRRAAGGREARAAGGAACAARRAAGDEAMWVALADARARFPISAKALARLRRRRADGHRTAALRTFDGLRDYCAHVAGAVGVACIGVYGADQPQQAETLGIALQLINVMRDVSEDWELGRVYLPQDELAAHGVTEDDIAAGRVTPAWQSLMAYQGARARPYLEEGLGLLRSLDRRSAACVGTFAGLYRATLERIEASGYDVFNGKPQLSVPAKLRIVARLVPLRVAVVGGGLAGLAAALELVDRGHEVVLHEARPTLGGAVQTLRSARETRRLRRTTASTSASAASPSGSAFSGGSGRATRSGARSCGCR